MSMQILVSSFIQNESRSLKVVYLLYLHPCRLKTCLSSVLATR